MTSQLIYSSHIDLRGTPCPINFVKCKLAIEELSFRECLEIYLDKGEPEEMVISGLKNEGHDVQIVQHNSSWIKLIVVCGAN